MHLERKKLNLDGVKGENRLSHPPLLIDIITMPQKLVNNLHYINANELCPYVIKNQQRYLSLEPIKVSCSMF